ncbi:hypothetical protein JG688_00002550 [Phytophthora aleatoria]|uniref:EF-hand domain-containing protein n=1 Tax=Phytophthora aleatoria TaxID=2496075 RepID=A0A8J5JAY8_9STRA|nr:hypothetical protein JG688_00002550 [Phytophthora aleatoria]
MLLRRSVTAASRPAHTLLRVATARSAFSTEVPVENRPLTDTLRELRASEHFDLIVIGSGPAGQKCAIDSAKHGKSVAIIDKRDMLGGVCVHTGTVPSKTFREAAMHLTGYRHKAFYNGQAGPSKRFGVEDILQRVRKVEDAETDITRHQLLRNGVQLINGTARFLPGNKSMVAVLSNESYETATDAKRHTSADICKRVLTADKFLVCVGTRPARRPDIPFDGETIFDSDQLLWGKVESVPRRLIIVGAGVVGMEYASMMTIIPGTDVTVIDGRQEILNMADKQVSEALCYSMAQTGTRFLTGETIKSVEKSPKGEVFVHLESGKTVVGDGLLYTVGRQGNVEGLDLEAVGLSPDKRGRIKVDNNFQTAVPHIYAAGDIIGFPGLASTSMEQGRLASVHMRTSKPLNDLELSDDKKMDDPDRVRTRMRSGEVFPFGIYTVPEISMVGKNEQQLTKEQVPYEVGVARYEELARGQMLGGVPGFLKIIFCPDTLKILGVHAIGEGATEIIHIGQVVMSTGGTLEYFRNAVFNYPTLAEAYRVAALNGLRKIDRLREMGLVSSLWSSGETCDLSEEQIEEIHMITALPPKEIHRIRRKYKTLVKSEDMTKDEFYALPAIAVNPLRDQLFKSLELTATQTITFAEFAKFVQIFSYSSSQDTKLKEAFKIHDFDGDGKISRDDLRAYCALVFPKISESDSDAIQSQQEVMGTLIEHVLGEASSAPSRDFLVYDDFVKVIQSTDFESRQIVPF